MSYVLAEDRAEWREIPQPHTDWGTWYGSEMLTLAAFNATHSSGASQQ